MKIKTYKIDILVFDEVDNFLKPVLVHSHSCFKQVESVATEIKLVNQFVKCLLNFWFQHSIGRAFRFLISEDLSLSILNC